ncbi:PREDICTED: uncharacterized protein LOC109227744 [Nicotiana attenuata]|uniref:uncharacterized protein LOC109227744 n=1 Tax=Nicotiana attenuata TaxID=49451 RepID=UPI000905B05F|nr:PREDICTED: uncharacterized protein LOC109227744 [Nicotiana attenuata]
MATGVAKMLMFQCVMHGILSLFDMDIERRPYHRYCSCASHKKKEACSNNTCTRSRNLPSPQRKTWNDAMSLSVTAAYQLFSPSSSCSNSSVISSTIDDSSAGLASRS